MIDSKGEMRLLKVLKLACAGALILLLAHCNNYNNNVSATPTPTPTPSNPNPTHFAKRVLISVSTPAGGDIAIADGEHDQLATQTVGVTNPGKMVTASGITAILSTTVAEITIFNNAGEVVFFTPAMQALPVDLAITGDGKTVFVAVKNKGVVEVVDTATGNITGNINVPTPSRLVMSPNSTNLLVFSDDPEAIPGSCGGSRTGGCTFFVIPVSSATTITSATPVTGPPLDQPFRAVFNGSETQAFILNCGPECGSPITNDTASVVQVDFSNPASPGFSSVIPTNGSTVGLISGGNLFIAGTPLTAPGGCNFAACGALTIINTSSLSVTSPSGGIPITDGLHQVMAMSNLGHLYIGASDCSVGPISSQNTVQSCLTVFNPSSNTTAGPLTQSSFRTNFNVVALQQISNRNVLYVAQGGAVDIFDTTTDNVSTSIEAFNITAIVNYLLQIDP